MRSSGLMQAPADEAKVTEAAIGFRVKSGWATAIVLGGPSEAPRALARHIVELSDPEVPASKQPYHAAMGVLEEDDAAVRLRVGIVRKVTARSLAALLDDARRAGWQIRRAGLAVGSMTDPAAISNPHIRAHALEGRLFRCVLEETLLAHGLTCRVIVERDAYRQAGGTLAVTEDELKRAVADIGRSLGGPWRAEEKQAALAAWMALRSGDAAEEENA